MKLKSAPSSPSHCILHGLPINH